MPTDAPLEARPSKKQSAVTPPPGPVSVQLEGSYVVIPLGVYDSLLTIQLEVSRGDYIHIDKVEERIKQSVNNALTAMTRTLEREVAHAARQSPIPGPTNPS